MATEDLDASVDALEEAVETLIQETQSLRTAPSSTEALEALQTENVRLKEENQRLARLLAKVHERVDALIERMQTEEGR